MIINRKLSQLPFLSGALILTNFFVSYNSKGFTKITTYFLPSMFVYLCLFIIITDETDEKKQYLSLFILAVWTVLNKFSRNHHVLELIDKVSMKLF